MSGLPVGDWQFWVVSAVALAALVEGDAPCERCAANPAAGTPGVEASTPGTSDGSSS
jgi:hypothetical protein